MAKDKPPAGSSADELYSEARAIWADAIDLDLFDDPRSIRRVAAILERAVKADPTHAAALGMLADLLAALTAYAEAEEYGRRVGELEPGVVEHARRLELLALPNGPDKRKAIISHLTRRWRRSEW
jgi:hypothetical protein